MGTRRHIKRVLLRLPSRVQQVLYKGGQRSDRLRDPGGVVGALGLRPGDRVADLGPGYGHFTLLLAQAVAPGGICYAVDADQAVLDDIARAAGERGFPNLRPTLTGRSQDCELPESVDLLFVSATYHHIKHPVEYFAGARPLHTSKRPRGDFGIAPGGKRGCSRVA